MVPLRFNVPLRNSHGPYSGQQAHLLSISCVPSAIWTQSEDSSLYFIDSATQKQYKSIYNLILLESYMGLPRWCSSKGIGLPMQEMEEIQV